jgi:hypothetical protein
VDKLRQKCILCVLPLTATQPNTKMGLIIAKQLVDFEKLLAVETPEATDSFMPIPHAMLVEMTREAIARAGLTIVSEEHSLARGGLRYFGGFALSGPDINGTDRRIVLGLRNSHDKAFAAAICIGNQMMVCENLCFSSDIKLARRHTVNILTDLPRVLADAVGRVVSHWNDMGKRIEAYKGLSLSHEKAADLLVSLVDVKAFPAREIYNAMQEFRKPSHEEFNGETMWSLYNAITECLKGGDLSKLPFRTMTVQSIFDRLAGHRPVIEVQEIVTAGCEDNAEPNGTDLRDDDEDTNEDFNPLVVDGTQEAIEAN